MTFPTYNFLWSTEDEYACHYRRYNIKNFKDKLSSNGYTVLYSSYFFSFLVIPIFIFRVIPSLFKKGNGDTEKDHVLKTPVKQLFSLFQKIEESIMKITPIPFGSSGIIVAKKKNTNHQYT